MFIVFIAGFFIAAENSLAAPSISGVSGTVSDGQSVIISGSSFGTKATAAPNLWDTVSNKYSLSNGATIPTGGSYPWEENGYYAPTGGTKFDSTAGDQRDIHSAACYKATGDDPTLRGHLVSGATELYISWWAKFTASTMGADQSSKFMRLNGNPYTGDAGNRTFSWDPSAGNYVFDNAYCPTPTGNDNDLGDSQWHFLEVYANQSSLKTLTMRTDGVTTTLNSSGCGSWNWDYVWLMGFDRGGTSPTNPTVYMDQIYIDNTRARVMIGNASTYAASGHFEMQPPTAWNSNGQSVTATVNQGSFANGATAYVYVVDSTGAVNANGYAVTFGSGGGGDTTPPASPTGLSVS